MTERRLQPWTPADDERLRKLAGEGRNATTIAERLKRSPTSVRGRAKNLGIMLVKASGLPAALAAMVIHRLSGRDRVEAKPGKAH
jgi:hypothetical protein